MAPFLYLFFPIVICFICNEKKLRHIEARYFIIACIGLFLLLGFRAEDVGIDTPRYYLSFYHINYFPIIAKLRYEPGYFFLNQVVDLLGFGPEMMIAVCSFMIVFSVSYFVFELSPAIGLSLILYAGLFGYFFAFNGVRQAVAQSLLLLGFALYFSNKRYLAVFVCILAPLFHYSSILFFPFLPVLYVRKKVLSIWILLIWIFSLPFVVFSKSFSFISSYVFAFVPVVYESYVENPNFAGGVGIATLFFQLYFLFVYTSYLRCRDLVSEKVMLLAMLGILIANITNYSGFISRISYFWDVFMIAAIPIAIFSTYRSWLQVILNFFFFTTAAVFYFRALFVSSNRVMPYSSWLF